MKEHYSRSFALDDIQVLSRAKGGDGRTIEAYAAVFDVPKEIHDRYGRYTEKIHRTAFNRTIANGAAERSLFLFNHGRNVIDGAPNPLAQVPLGSPVSIQADGKGLRTVARVNKSALGEATLAAVSNGDIKAYSFRGSAYQSDPAKTPRVRPGEALPIVTRMELGLDDFGPAPNAYYEEAEIVAVRSAEMIVSSINGLTESERAELIRMLLATTPPGQEDPEPTTATPGQGPGTQDPRPVAHSRREQDIARQRELASWAELAGMEMVVRG